MARCDYVRELFPPKHFKTVRNSLWQHLHNSKGSEVEYAAGESVWGQRQKFISSFLKCAFRSDQLLSFTNFEPALPLSFTCGYTNLTTLLQGGILLSTGWGTCTGHIYTLCSATFNPFYVFMSNTTCLIFHPLLATSLSVSVRPKYPRNTSVIPSP